MLNSDCSQETSRYQQKASLRLKKKPTKQTKKTQQLLLDFFLLASSGSSKSPALAFLILANTITWQEKQDLSIFQATLWDLIQVVSVVYIWKYIGMGLHDVQ